MKKLLNILSILAISSILTFAQSSKTPLGLEANKLSVSLSGGAFIPVVGKYNAALDVKDVLETGTTFAGSLAYSASPLWSFRGTFDFAYNYFEPKYRHMDMKHTFVAPTITGDVILKFGSLIKGNETFNPYCFSGAGAYIWKFSADKIDGDAMTSAKGKDWKESSFGLHTGIGSEVYVSPTLALFAEGQFRYIFSKNTDDFGNDFENIGFVKIGGGLTYYF